MQIRHHEPESTETTTSTKQVRYFQPLEEETRSHVNTACAAYHLTRQPQTMRAWACLENGPIRPSRIKGRLAWSVADIKHLLSGGQ